MTIPQSQRLRLNCFGTTGHINAFSSKIVSVKNAPEPVNISWENLQVSPLEKKVRRVISWMATLFLIGIPILVVVLISLSIKKNETLKFSCPKNSIFGSKDQALSSNTMQILVSDFKSPESENLMFCYCYADFRNRINTYSDSY